VSFLDHFFVLIILASRVLLFAACVVSEILSIDKLNTIINGLEKGMMELKTEYESAVESRNYAGIQLIDRNDELVILYEKARVQTGRGGRGGGGTHDFLRLTTHPTASPTIAV
jgi:hypothetical protein